METSDLDRLNNALGQSRSLVRPIYSDESTRDALNRWPSLQEPYQSLAHSMQTLRTFEDTSETSSVSS